MLCMLCMLCFIILPFAYQSDINDGVCTCKVVNLELYQNMCAQWRETFKTAKKTNVLFYCPRELLYLCRNIFVLSTFPTSSLCVQVGNEGKACLSK